MNIGIDFGGTTISAGIVENGKVLYKDTIDTHSERTYEEILTDIINLVEKLTNKDSSLKVEKVGMAVPGTIDSELGKVIYSCNFSFENKLIKKDLQDKLKLPVFIENDANCAALGESCYGGAKNKKDSITLTLGTGIGAGIIINNKIHKGFNSTAGEIGHMVIEQDGLLCTCGRKGCWETFASTRALVRQTREAAKNNPDSKINQVVNNNIKLVDGRTLFKAMDLNDKTAEEVFNKYISYLASGITNIINIFAPEIILIGGGISNEGERLLAPLREIVYKDVYCKYVDQTEIARTQLGSDSGIIGASVLNKEI